MHMSMSPTLEATTYHTMYVFGNHLRLSSGEKHFTTRDNGIVATFEQECVLWSNDQWPILAKLEYVGWFKEILELNYGVLNIIVFFCNWVKASYTRSNVTIKKNEYNFTLVNFNSLIPISNQSFSFPTHVITSVFLVDPKEKRWKVIQCKNPCGKWSKRGVDSDPIDLDMFRIENDDSYTSLQAQISIPKVTQIATIVGGIPLMPIDLVVVATIGMN